METLVKKDELVLIRNHLKKQQRNLFFSRFWANKLAVVGLSVLSLLIILLLIGPLFTSFGPYEMVVNDRLNAPSSTHVVGTDNFGRDLLSRIIYGGRISMGVGLLVAIITSLFGMVIGLYSSYYRMLDNVLMRICDGIMAFPPILLAIALMAALGPSAKNVILSLSVVYIPYIARVVRSAALVVREETYIEAMEAQGASSWRIIWSHIAPNTLSPLIVQATFIFANTIITEAALSFVGAGVPAPSPSWGNILYDGKLVIFKAWWMVVFPGICLVMSVLGLNLFGDGLRDILDPQTNKAKK